MHPVVLCGGGGGGAAPGGGERQIQDCRQGGAVQKPSGKGSCQLKKVPGFLKEVGGGQPQFLSPPPLSKSYILSTFHPPPHHI